MRWLAGLAVLLVLILVMAVALGNGGGRAGTAVIGDRTPAILEAAGWSQTLPLGTAGLTVVSVEDWDRLSYIADMAALCGRACAGDATLVRVVALAPRGSHKVLFVRLEGWPRAEGGEEPDLACLALTLHSEAQTLLGPSDTPACAGNAARARTRWALPFDLGTL